MADITDSAYETTWGTIRIINLNAAKNAVGPVFSLSKTSLAAVDFKAFLTNFKDSFNPGWSEQQFPNQSVPIAHQVSPKRTIQFSFSVPAYSEDEAILNMRKCSFLAESMYPMMEHQKESRSYNLKSSFMAIKFANLIQNAKGGALPGYIMGFVFAPDLEHGVFINTKEGFGQKNSVALYSDRGSYIIPKSISIDITFTPIEMRDQFGYQQNASEGLFTDFLVGEGWQNNGSWPHGVKADTSSGLLPGNSSGDLSPNSRVTSIVDAAASDILS